MVKTIILFLALSGISCQTLPLRTSEGLDEPDVTVALSFINGYVAFCNEGKSENQMLAWVSEQSILTDNFKFEWSKIISDARLEDPEYGLGFDPIFDAQDYPEGGFELDSVAQYYVIVRGKEMSEFRLTIKLIKQNDVWLVDGAGIINIPDEKRIKR